jgi:cytochrome d ubiquinol oxidase subunit II
MMTIDYNLLWFFLVGVLLTGYAILDGFDLGVGSLHLFTRNDHDRRILMNSIGPVWDGNEVWLVTGGGALFAAFPEAYATAFSGFYLAFMLVLFALIFRAVALEFRSKRPERLWRGFWDVSFSVASTLAALLFGVAFGNIFRGLQIGPDGYAGTFLGLLNPYALLTGLLFCAFFLFHGQLWLAHKVAGPAAARAARIAGRAWYPLLGLFAAWAVYSWADTGLSANFIERSWLLLLPLGAGVSLLAARLLLARGRAACAFGWSFGAIALFSLAGFAGIYPDLLPSRLDPALGLNVYNSASSAYTLRLMAWVVALFLPVVVAYQYWVHRVFGAPLSAAELKRSGMY